MFSVISSHYTLYSTSFNYDDKKLEIQQYLCLPLPKNLVSYLTKLRISAHQLYVETGRYCNPAIHRENKFCFHCKNSLYKHVRKQYSKLLDT